MRAHEYSVVGHSRASIGRYLGAGAALVASAATAWGIGLASFAKDSSLPAWAQSFVLIPISAGTVYVLAHWLFNRFGWRSLSWISQVPNIAGSWGCAGITIDEEGKVKFKWEAKITISQDWEKIRVNLKTKQSGSNSVSAALIPEADGSWMLMYSYRNEPRVGETELNSHVGYCEMHFEKDLRSGEGDYFNARGRGTVGRMRITREI